MLRSSETRSAPPGASDWHPRNYFDRASRNLRHDLQQVARIVPGLRRVQMVNQAIGEHEQLIEAPITTAQPTVFDTTLPLPEGPQLELVEGLEALPDANPTDVEVLAFLVGADATPVLEELAKQDAPLPPSEPMVFSGDVLALTTEAEAAAQLHVKAGCEAIVFPEAFDPVIPPVLHADESELVTMATLYLQGELGPEELTGFVEREDVPLAFGEDKLGDMQTEQLIFVDTQGSIS